MPGVLSLYNQVGDAQVGLDSKAGCMHVFKCAWNNTAAVPWCTGPNEKPIEFAVDYEHRNTEKFDRLEVINTFVNCIKTPPHKVSQLISLSDTQGHIARFTEAQRNFVTQGQSTVMALHKVSQQSRHVTGHEAWGMGQEAVTVHDSDASCLGFRTYMPCVSTCLQG
eukprot:1160987-Pelagomonas_calceolata.AAC.11